MSDKTIFKVQDVYAGYGKKEVLKGINFEIKQNMLAALVGVNGSGKSTLIKCIANQIPHQGKCILETDILEELSVKRLAQNVSYMPQKSSLQISISVMDVVLMGFNPVLKLLEKPSMSHKKAVTEALERVGLKGYESVDFQTLSEGQKQLVFLARTMIENTRLLLLDEPDSALDFSNRHRILKVLKQMIQTEGKAGILCIHDPSLALEFCDLVILLKDGVICSILELNKTDIYEMEQALCEIYGNVSIAECKDRQGKRHLKLLWEEEV